MDGDDSGVAFSDDAEHDINDDVPQQMSLQQFPLFQQPQYPQRQNQRQHQHHFHRPSGGRLSIQDMLSPSTCAADLC